MSELETKSTDSIGQVWVVVDEDGGTGVMDTHEDQFVMEPASVADLVAALLNEGGEIMFARPSEFGHVGVIDVLAQGPGRYLVVPLEDE